MYVSSNEDDRNKLKQFLINVILEKREISWLQDVRDSQILTNSELNDLENDIKDKKIPVPSLSFLNEWKCNSKRKKNYNYKI